MEPQHELEIEESSIDNIDRDSSVLSSEQHFFNEPAEVQPAKKIPIPKKVHSGLSREVKGSRSKCWTLPSSDKSPTIYL